MSEQFETSEQSDVISFDELSINNDAITSSINYEDTSKMRMELSMSRIQQYSAMAVVDSDFKAKYDAWVGYYNSIKNLSVAGDYEGLYAVELPE